MKIFLAVLIAAIAAINFSSTTLSVVDEIYVDCSSRAINTEQNLSCSEEQDEFIALSAISETVF